MRYAVVVLTLVAFNSELSGHSALSGSGCGLQQTTKPSFAGQWIERESSERLTIVETSESVTVTSKLGQRTEALTYRFDGKPSKNTIPTVAGDLWTIESQARLVGKSLLVISKTTRETGANWEWIRIISLEASLEGTDPILNEVVIDHPHEAGSGMVTRLKTFRKQKAAY